MKKTEKQTPLMRQYDLIKKKYPGALLLFRVGDFYETFGEDAIKASKILGIVLTKRSNGAASKVELAGFPHHALDNYLPKLVKAGERVAICDQLEDPKQTKGIVKRGVTELVTPGLSLNDNVLESNKNNYLSSIHIEEQGIGAAFLDISTGEFWVTEGSKEDILQVLQSFKPSEILCNKKQKNLFTQYFGTQQPSYFLEDWVFQKDYTHEKLLRQFEIQSLKGFGIDKMERSSIAAGTILHYLEETEHKNIHHISSLSRLAKEKYVWLDQFTIKNLELLYPQHEMGVSLIDVMDHTQTPMGARLLKKWIVMPLKEVREIRKRQTIVGYFVQKQETLDHVVSHLKPIGDLERIISKVATRRINPKEVLSLKNALSSTLPIKKKLTEQKECSELIDKIQQIEGCEELIEEIARVLQDEVPIQGHSGNMIKTGVNEELDELRDIAWNGKDYLKKITQRESERTGIPSLKIAYNKVFGYYLEVTNAHKDKVPQEWMRKQTLVNAERYITEELKTYEEKIISAEEKINSIELEIFNALIDFAAKYLISIQKNAQILAYIDVLTNFAYNAIQFKYVQPAISEGKSIEIKAGRHPVIEQQMPLGDAYIPNDIYLNNEEHQILIITGPNMAGKSALLRQVALITLMAQMGSFVPASQAEIGWVDKIFTRVGASDNIAKGESTFMVEMMETASIMNNLSERSLVLMDEIGRGTSTYDGISIAWSILEYLAQNHRPKTLFATHYHELSQLEEQWNGIKNYNVSIKESEDKILFLRTLKKGSSAHSFGIHVAQMAGMPKQLVSRAREILKKLEKEKNHKGNKKEIQFNETPNYQLSLFELDLAGKKIREEIESMDLNNITPIEALIKLQGLKNKIAMSKTESS